MIKPNILAVVLLILGLIVGGVLGFAATPAILISSFGWHGVAGKMVTDILKSAGFEIIDVVECKGVVDKALLEKVKMDS